VSIIWIVEKAKASGSTLASALMGDFAVRVFSSLESFEKLLRMRRGQRPDLLLVDLADVALARLREPGGRHLQDVPVVCVEPEGQTGEAGEEIPSEGTPSLSPRHHLLRRPLDGLGLSAFVDVILGGDGGRRSLVSYRDVTLDWEKLHLFAAGAEAPIALPLKEAQLLRLFLQRPGVCLGRDEIRRVIWDTVTVTPRTIDSHISRLRTRLQDASVNIESVYGGGYVLK
jgi:DNA-binding response OmpR family regulator